jgi:hypothetical protein
MNLTAFAAESQAQCHWLVKVVASIQKILHLKHRHIPVIISTKFKNQLLDLTCKRGTLAASVAEPDDFGLDPDTLKRSDLDPDPTPEKNADPDPALFKNFVPTFCNEKFLL